MWSWPWRSDGSATTTTHTEQLIGMQAQLMQAMMHHLDNQHAVVPPPVLVRDKRGEFMKECPPVFTHASNPLEADDWLRVVEKQLNIAQCNEVEKGLQSTAMGYIGMVGVYQYVHPNNAPLVTWREFTKSFRSYHIPEGLLSSNKRSSVLSSKAP